MGGNRDTRCRALCGNVEQVKVDDAEMGSRCFNDDSKLPSESAWLGRRLLARSCSIHFYPRCMFFRRSIGFVDAHRLGWHFMDSLITSHLCTGRAVTVAGGDYLQKAPGITDGDCQAVGFGKCFT